MFSPSEGYCNSPKYYGFCWLLYVQLAFTIWVISARFVHISKVSTLSSSPSIYFIYSRTPLAVRTLVCLAASSNVRLPCMMFVFLRPEIFRRLLSDSTLRGHPCLKLWLLLPSQFGTWTLKIAPILGAIKRAPPEWGLSEHKQRLQFLNLSTIR